jgi:cbb3-type cytochrome oxidase maturation protein
MSFLWITIPATLVLAGSLLAWVLLEVNGGGFDDLEAPAARAALDDDSTPERSQPAHASLSGGRVTRRR